MPRAKKFLQRSMVLASRPRCWRAVRVRRCNSTAKTRNLSRSEEHTSELQSRLHLVCRLLLEKKKNKSNIRVGGSKLSFGQLAHRSYFPVIDYFVHSAHRHVTDASYYLSGLSIFCLLLSSVMT